MNTLSVPRSKIAKQSRLISPLLQSTALTLSLAISAFILSSTPALAINERELPTGGTVVGGNATLNYGAPGQLDINQSSDRAVIDWNSFNIGEKAATTFKQPSSSALAVNRVTGAGEDPTQILGTLRANGRIVVLDRNGVIFGKNSRIDTAGIIASTGDVDTAKVMSGSKTIELSNMDNGAVENHGEITIADGGLAALVAPSVRNSGTINARLGRVALASGEKVTVDLYGDQLIEIATDEQTSKALIEQTGTISAEGGSIKITAAAAKNMVDSVINMDGVTSASSVSAEGGKIVLSSNTINVAATARIEANAAAGHAGGDVRVIARDKGRYAGKIEAKGATGTGFVETSAKTLEFVEGTEVATTGEWLIDPTNVTIDSVLEGLIETALGSSSAVAILTSAAGPDTGNIYVNRTIDWSSASSLTLQADNDILFGSTQSGLNATGAGNIILNAAHNVNISAGSGISTNGGDVTINSQRFRLSAGSINAYSGNIDINNTAGFEALANALTTEGTGTISLRQNKDADPFLSTNSIQNAINAINNTGSGLNTVDVGAGTYAENVVIDRSLTLNGANAGVAFDGARSAETVIAPTTTACTLLAASVTIDGFTITGGNNGIVAAGAANAKIQNNIIQGQGSHGISIGLSSYALIKNNLLYHVGGNGILLNNASNYALVSGNVVNTTGQAGIQSTDSIGGSITSNYVGFTDRGVTSAGTANINGDGIQVRNANNSSGIRTLISNNKVAETRSPTTSYGSGVHVLHSVSVDVTNNTIINTMWDGIRMYGGADITVVGNSTNNAKRDGIYFTGFNGALVSGNTVTNALTAYGVDGDNSDNATISNNTVNRTAMAGINLTNMRGLTTVDANMVDNTGSSGIQSNTVANLKITNNEIGMNGGNIGADGIQVIKSVNTGSNRSTISGNIINDTHSPTSFYGSGIQVRYSNAIDVTNNIITNTMWDGIRMYGGTDITVVGNSTDNIKRDGIYFTGISGILVDGNIVTNTQTAYGIDGDNSTDASITNNIIDTIAMSGINVYNQHGSTVIKGNRISNSHSNGVNVSLTDNLEVGLNSISTAAGSGIYIHGPYYANNVIYGNTVTSSDVGMTFESGLIDLTRAANTLSSTRVGYRFIPSAVKGGFAQLDLAGNTIGSTVFNNQATYYVELRNNALYAPGAPTQEEGINAVYDGLTPALTGNFITALQLQNLESKFWHYNDDNTLGLFFFGTTPPLAISRVFRQGITSFAPGAGAAGVTITALPRLPGTATPDITTPEALNALAPAAGPGAKGELNANPTAEQVAAIEPAAGLADASCWSDAANLVGTGRSVSYSFATDPVAVLSDASSCGNTTQ